MLKGARAVRSKVDLNRAYDKTLRDIAKSYLPVLKDFGNDVESVIQHGDRRLNEQYYQLMKLRKQQPRHSSNVLLYNDFLRQLYTNIDDARHDLRLNELYKSYQKLPYPAPRYIEPQHLEDLIALLMSEIKVHNSMVHRAHKYKRLATIYLSILGDLQATDMPITVREYNSALNLTAKSNNIDAVREWFQQLKSVDKSDVYSLGMLMSIAVRFDNNELFNTAVTEMTERGLKPDRNMLMTFMTERGKAGDVDGLQRIYKDFESVLIIDIEVLNRLMRELIKCGEADTAESLFHALDSDGYSETHPRLQRKVLLMDLFQTTVRQEAPERLQNFKVPTVPNHTTFAIFFDHYCNVGNLQAAGDLLLTFEPTIHMYYRLFRELRQARTGLDIFKRVLSQSLIYNQKCFSYLMAESLVKTFNALSSTQLPKVRQSPRVYSVHNLIKKMMI